MSAFAEVETEYLNAQRLGRMATVGAPQFFRLRPHRVISWGLEGSGYRVNARERLCLS